MKRFDRALEDCLSRIAGGENAEQCLQRYPELAGQLRPLLRTAGQVKRTAAAASLPEGFKERGRARLVAYMHAHPQGSAASRPSQARRGGSRGMGMIWRLSVGLAVVVLAFFAVGSTAAQSALPGQVLYNWKRASESVWLAVSPDPVKTELTLAQRRAQEAVAVTGANQQIALEGLDETLTRLMAQSRSDPTIRSRVLPALTLTHDLLEASGIAVPELDEYLSQPIPAPSSLSPTPEQGRALFTPAEGEPLESPTPTGNGEGLPGTEELTQIPPITEDLTKIPTIIGKPTEIPPITEELTRIPTILGKLTEIPPVTIAVLLP